MQMELQAGYGYSKAIDIWSIGCVTATMINNVPMFPHLLQYDLSEIELPELAACLEVLDDRQIWGHIGVRAKGFLRGCLAPKDADRLTAREGLSHEWFTHPHYRADFDAAYKRAIQDWKPRPYDANVVKTIDTSHIKIKEVRSHHFEAPQPRPASCSRSSDQAAMIARWRPGTLHASPAVDEYDQLCESRFVTQEHEPQSVPSHAEIQDSQDEYQDAYINNADENDLDERLYQASQSQANNRNTITSGHY
jgi:serine/threonine protein kinase